ncbi:potassium channel family protein [Fervidobacterium islandicum]|uniref:potassium channel family protein n=1 Tax=Fervidobacterium islandicum TaxID=2423 RepID=UPI003A718C66
MKLSPININISADLRLYVIVVGCGKIGLEVATRLSRIGFNVTVVDKNPNTLDLLPEDYGGFVIIGDATERGTMERAKAIKADLLVVTTEDDSTNYFISLVGAKIFGIPRIISLVNDRENIPLFIKSGIDVISPTELTVDSFQNNILEHIEPKVGEKR